MMFLRTILPALALVLLLGFTVTLAEEMFCCAEGEATTTACAYDCCSACVTLHHMALSQQQVPLTIDFKVYSYYSLQSSFTQTSFPLNINRPPIAS